MMTHLLIAEPPLQVMPALAEVLGFNEAAILQVTHYWLSPTVNPDFRDGCRWVQNLAFHLQGRFPFWGGDDIGYMVAQLEQSGILIFRYGTTSEDIPISWHTINYGRLEGLAPVLNEVEPEAENFVPEAPKQKANSNMRRSFRAVIHDKGDGLYIMAVEDMRHVLACELTLEVQKTGQEGEPSSGDTIGEVVCHFPRISDGEFLNFVWDDPTLYIILKDFFLMKIMEQLLLFCAAHHVGRLTLFSDDAREADLEIYRRFLASIGKPAPKGEGTGLAMLIGNETLDAWRAFVKRTGLEFQKTLWSERKKNPAIEHYLNNQDGPG